MDFNSKANLDLLGPIDKARNWPDLTITDVLVELTRTRIIVLPRFYHTTVGWAARASAVAMATSARGPLHSLNQPYPISSRLPVIVRCKFDVGGILMFRKSIILVKVQIPYVTAKLQLLSIEINWCIDIKKSKNCMYSKHLKGKLYLLYLYYVRQRTLSQH